MRKRGQGCCTPAPTAATRSWSPSTWPQGFRRTAALLIDTAADAASYPRGDVELAHCATCDFIANTRFDPALEEYSPRYEKTQHYSKCFDDWARRLAEYLVDKYGLRDKRIIEIGCGKGRVPEADLRARGEHRDRNRPGLRGGAPCLRAGDARAGLLQRGLPRSQRGCGLLPAHAGTYPANTRVRRDGAARRGFRHARLFRGTRRDAHPPRVRLLGHPLRALLVLLAAVPRAALRRLRLPDSRNHARLRRPVPLAHGHARAARHPPAQRGRGKRRRDLRGLLRGDREGVATPRRLHEAAGHLGRRVEIRCFLRDARPRPGRLPASSTSIRGSRASTLPGTGHEVVAPEALKQVRPSEVLVLNPTYRGEIQATLAELGIDAPIIAV